MKSSRLQEELQWHPRAPVPEQEAYLNLRRTHDLLATEFAALFKQYGVTEAQFNILRILAGAAGRSLPCLAIRDRLIARVPDITRLVDGLERAELVARKRGDKDRRVVHVTITRKGLALLSKLAAPLLAMHKQQFQHFTPEEVARLNRLLEKARDR
ncbi:MarR family transcriptional regulator [bacterium]|nr:MarR family transcriptional regulator [bacterium]